MAYFQKTYNPPPNWGANTAVEDRTRNPQFGSSVNPYEDPYFKMLQKSMDQSGGQGGDSGMGRISRPTYGNGTPTMPSYNRPTWTPPQMEENVTSNYKAKNIDQVGPIDTKASHDAAFGQAKDEAAMTAQAALTGLQGSLASRGMGGGGYEAGGIGREVMRGANTIGQASRAQAQSEADRAQRTAEFNANLGLNQRGQDMDWQSQLLGADVTQRGQNLGARGQDIGWQGQLASNDLQARGQDMSRMNQWDQIQSGLVNAGYQGDISQRGQDLGYKNSNENRRLQYLQSLMRY